MGELISKLAAVIFLILIIYVEYKDYKDKKDYKEELLGRFPNEEIYLNLTTEEKYMLKALAAREDLTIDKYIRQAIKEWSIDYEY